MDQKLIKSWVDAGEGERLEFKLKANHPDKIIREMVAFANTKGGYLVVGISDDRKVVGVKYPEEAQFQIDKALRSFCSPELSVQVTTYATSDNRKLLIYQIPKGNRLPHFVVDGNGIRRAYFRVGEQSIQASRELCTILRKSSKPENTAFAYGRNEQVLMQILDKETFVTVESFAAKAGIDKKKASKILVLMVLAKVIRIHPSDNGDKFSMIPISPQIQNQPYVC